MPVPDPAKVVLSMPEEERHAWLRSVASDDAADLIQDAALDEGTACVRRWLDAVVFLIVMAHILIWHQISGAYGAALAQVALVVGASLIAVVASRAIAAPSCD